MLKMLLTASDNAQPARQLAIQLVVADVDLKSPFLDIMGSCDCVALLSHSILFCLTRR